jgi:hypothetical protein
MSTVYSKKLGAIVTEEPPSFKLQAGNKPLFCKEPYTHLAKD